MSKLKPKIGRPLVELDWNFIDDLLTWGCSGSQVAARIGVHPKTLYDRCLIEKELPFCEYIVQKREKGDTLLKEQQFKKALGLTDLGDNTMLVWLGKNRLNQRDKQPDEIDNNITIKVVDARNHITEEVSVQAIPKLGMDSDPGRV